MVIIYDLDSGPFTNRNENAEVHFVFGANNFHDDDECDQEVPFAGNSSEEAKGSVAPVVVYECPGQLKVDKLDTYKSQSKFIEKFRNVIDYQFVGS